MSWRPVVIALWIGLSPSCAARPSAPDEPSASAATHPSRASVGAPPIFFDHAINLSLDEAIFLGLEERGFTLDKTRASRQGSDHCYYLFFPPERERPRYVELCAVDDVAAFSAGHQKRGTRSGVDALAPGIALRVESSLATLYMADVRSRRRGAGCARWRSAPRWAASIRHRA